MSDALFHRAIRGAVWCLFASALTACGGGGGDTSVPPPPAPPSSAPAPSPAPAPIASDYRVGGKVKGLLSPGLILKLNGGQDLEIDLDRSFEFPTAVATGSDYRVTVDAQPLGQRCAIRTGAAGRVGPGSPSILELQCQQDMQGMQTSRVPDGQLRGLSSGTVVIGLDDGQELRLSENGRFAFGPLGAGRTDYRMTVKQSPPGQVCDVTFAASGPAISPLSARVTCVEALGASQSLSGLQIQYSQLRLRGAQGERMSPVTVAAYVADGPAPLKLKLEYSGESLKSVDIAFVKDRGALATVRFKEPSELTPGTQVGALKLSACMDSACTKQAAGSPKTMTFTYEVEPADPPARLKVEAAGVALVQTPGVTRLTRQLKVWDSSKAASRWEARSDQAWLQVTASGASGEAVEFRANTVGLAEGVHYASVTLKSSNPAISEPVQVRVGLQVSAGPLGSRLTGQMPLSPWGSTYLAGSTLDPIRPWLYVSSKDRIAVHDLYSGAPLSELKIAGADRIVMDVSDDGRKLYALDRAPLTKAEPAQMVVIDADQLIELKRYPLPPFVASLGGQSQLRFVRVDGQEALVLTGVTFASTEVGGEIRTLHVVLRPDDGAYLGQMTGSSTADFMWPAPGNRQETLHFSTAGFSSGPMTVEHFELRRNRFGNIFATRDAVTPYTFGGWGAESTAVSPDGRYVVFPDERSSALMLGQYSASAYAIQPFSGGWGTVTFAPDGRLIHWYGTTCRRYGLDWKVDATWECVVRETAHKMAVSPDGGRLLIGTELINMPD